MNSSNVIQSEQPNEIMESNNNSSQLQQSSSEEASLNLSESQPVSLLASSGAIDKRGKGGRKKMGLNDLQLSRNSTILDIEQSG